MQSASPGKKNSKVIIPQNKNEVTVSGAGSEGGYKNALKINWNSTHAMSHKGTYEEQGRDRDSVLESSEYGEGSAGNVSKLNRRLYNIHEVERYCKPQYLTLYRPEQSGIKYNVMGLFGIPDGIDPLKPCVYTVLASIFPPANPYKPKP